MTDLCPSCREPLDYPSGDGCAAMTLHKPVQEQCTTMVYSAAFWAAVRERMKMTRWGEINCPRCEDLEAKLAQQDDLVKRMNDARDFPANTCGASRHAAMIAEALCSGDDYPMLAEEPDHCGESIAATVAALWECRTKLAQQDDLVQAAVAAAKGESDDRVQN
jgi:hypothetical protein